jgi:predicted ATPase
VSLLARAAESRPGNLPAQATALIGRDELLEAGSAVLRRSNARLLTLTGPGGTGKTRLALQLVANLAEEHEHGAWFVALAPLRDPHLLLPTIASTLGVAQGDSDLTARLRAYLRDRDMVLLLDNFEQILDAAPAVAALLAAAPALRVIVTSRIVLRIDGEHELGVPPLSAPPREGAGEGTPIESYAAVRLFVERAKSVRPGFAITPANSEAIAGICAKVDGLPLAVELAAARTRLLGPSAILERLEAAGGRSALLTGGRRDQPARQRTLRDTIAWSHDLLSEEDRVTFRRLGVFSGGASLDGIAGVLGDASALERVEALLDNSLLSREEPDGEPRVQMLETIREFATDELRAKGEEERMRSSHAAYFLKLAEDAEPALIGPDQARWFRRLDREFFNFRDVFVWAEECGDADAALRLGIALTPMGRWRGRAKELADRLEATLARAHAVSPGRRARALVALANAWAVLGNVAVARARADESIYLLRKLDDPHALVDALDVVGLVTYWCGDLNAGDAARDEMLTLARQLGDNRRLGRAIYQSSLAAGERGEIEHSEALARESLRLTRVAGDVAGIAWGLHWLGEHQRFQHRFAEAAAFHEEALALGRQLGDLYRISVSGATLASCRLRLGDTTTAINLCIEAVKLTVQIGNARNLCFAPIEFAAIAAKVGHARAGARWVGAADRALEEHGTPPDFVDRDEREMTLVDLRAALDPSEFDAATEEGRRLTIAEAVAEALAMFR